MTVVVFVVAREPLIVPNFFLADDDKNRKADTHKANGVGQKKDRTREEWNGLSTFLSIPTPFKTHALLSSGRILPSRSDSVLTPTLRFCIGKLVNERLRTGRRKRFDAFAFSEVCMKPDSDKFQLPERRGASTDVRPGIEGCALDD